MIESPKWDGIYSRWSFDELKQYAMVLKEIQVPGTGQRVPLLDSELNENQEIMVTALRRFIASTYGDGTEDDGFKIEAMPENNAQNENNFLIKGGNGTAEGSGTLFVAGWRLMIPSDIQYVEMLPTPPALSTPDDNRKDEVYVDVCYDEAGPLADAEIIDPAIGFETSRRLVIKWTIKVIEGGTAPAPYTDANGLPHWIYKIAEINRPAKVPQILDTMIVDARTWGAGRTRKEYLHRQLTPSAIWTVTHNLNIENAYGQVFGADGVPIEAGKVQKIDTNSLTIEFDGISVAGLALIKGVRILY
jgi:hypothetical protein